MGMSGTGFRLAVLGAAAVLLAACGNGKAQPTVGANPGDNTVVSTIPEPPDPDTASLTPANVTLTVSKSVWDDYQVYLQRVGRIGSGYYVVTEDGLGGASWSCSDAFCGIGFDGKAEAMKTCETNNAGKSCIVFAKDTRPQVRYEIAQ
jgi:hypothetical protein